jgi:hypothetical protein
MTQNVGKTLQGLGRVACPSKHGNEQCRRDGKELLDSLMKNCGSRTSNSGRRYARYIKHCNPVWFDGVPMVRSPPQSKSMQNSADPQLQLVVITGGLKSDLGYVFLM